MKISQGLQKIFLSVGTAVLITVPSVVLAATAEHGGAHHGNPGPGLKLIFQEINFILLLTMLYLLLRKPVREFFSARAIVIRRFVNEAGQAYEKALADNQHVSSRLASINQEVNAMVQSMKDQGEAMKARILEQANEYSAKLKEDAKRISESETARASHELKEMATKLAQDLAVDILRKELTQQDDTRLTQRYLQQLGKI